MHFPQSSPLPQFIALAGIFAGFCINITSRLISHAEQPRITSWVLSLLFAGAGAMIITACGGSIVMMEFGEASHSTLLHQATLLRLEFYLSWTFIVGLMLFLAGGATAGWIHSRRVGLVASSVMGVVALTILVVLYRVVSTIGT